MEDVKRLSVRLEAQISDYLARMGAAAAATEGFGTAADRGVGKASDKLRGLGPAATEGMAPLAALQGELGRIGEGVSARIGVNDAAAQAELKAFSGQLDRLRSGVAAQVGVDGVGATLLEIDKVKASLASLDGKEARVKVDDGGSAKKTEQGISALLQAAAGLGPALIPIGAVAAGGLGAIGAAALPAAAGLGALGLVASQTLTTVAAGSTAIEKYDTALAVGGRSSTQMATAHRALATALAGLSPAQQKAAYALNAFQDAYRGFRTSFDPLILGVFTSGLHLLQSNVGLLRPLITGAGTAISGLLTRLSAFTASPAFQSFAAWLGSATGAAITSLGRTVGNLAMGFGNLLRAFSPLVAGLESGMVKGSAAFARWAATLGKTAGFQAFLDYLRQNGPQVGTLLKNLGVTLIELTSALAPYGSLVLNTLVPITSALAGFAAALNKLPAPVGAFLGAMISMALVAGRVKSAYTGIGSVVGKALDLILGKKAATVAGNAEAAASYDRLAVSAGSAARAEEAAATTRTGGLMGMLRSGPVSAPQFPAGAASAEAAAAATARQAAADAELAAVQSRLFGTSTEAAAANERIAVTARAAALAEAELAVAQGRAAASAAESSIASAALARSQSSSALSAGAGRVGGMGGLAGKAGGALGLVGGPIGLGVMVGLGAVTAEMNDYAKAGTKAKDAVAKVVAATNTANPRSLAASRAELEKMANAKRPKFFYLNEVNAWTQSTKGARGALAAFDKQAADARARKLLSDTILQGSAAARLDAVNMGALTDRIKSNTTATTSAWHTADTYNEALAQVTDTIKANGRTHDQNTVKGRANREALLSLVDASHSQIATLISQNATSGTLNKTVAAQRAAFLAQAIATGYSKDQAAALATQLGLIPKSVSSQIALKGAAEAEAALGRLSPLLRNAHYTQTVSILTSERGRADGDPGLLHGMTGRVPGNAVGGRIQAGELSTISERGFEGFRPDFGSGAGTVQVLRPTVSGVVIPHAQMLAAGYGPQGQAPGGKTQVVEVNRGPLIGSLTVQVEGTNATPRQIADAAMAAVGIAARNGMGRRD